MAKIKEDQIQKKLDKRLLINVLLLALTFIVLLNLFMVAQIRASITPREVPQVELIVIVAPLCDVCAKLGDIREDLFLDRFEVINDTRIDYQQAEDLIKKYGLTNVPAALIKVDNKLADYPFPYIDDAYVVSPGAPYVDPLSGEIKGKVNATLITPIDCPSCVSHVRLLEDVKGIVFIEDIEEFSWPGDRADKLVEKYGLTKLPTLILSEQANSYPLLMAHWNRVGMIASDRSLVMDKTPPPYFDFEKHEIVGMLEVIVLVEPSCDLCSDPKKIIDAMESLGVHIKTITEMDVRESQDIVQRYGISKVPSIIVSGDVATYSLFDEVWGDVGTWESDGSFVFRNQQSLKDEIYYDLDQKEMRVGN